MKILFITHHFHKGKAKYMESHSLTLLGLKKQLERMGNKVDILQTNKLINKVNKEYDIIHSFSASPLRVLQNLLIRQNALRFHTLRSEPVKHNHGYWLLNFMNGIFVPLPSLRRRTNYVVVNSNIDTKKFKPLNIKKHKKKTIFYWGALWDNKGVNDLLKAMKELPNINLRIAPRYNKLTELNQELIKLPNVKILKTHDKYDIVKEINKAHLVVLPYKSLIGTETTPSCLIEAWACKVPVLTSNLPQLKEFGSDMCAYFKAGNVKDLTKKIKYELNHNTKMRTIAAHHMAKLHDHERVAISHLIYYNLL